MLYEHPAVADAAVTGIPHHSLGEEVGSARSWYSKRTSPQVLTSYAIS